MANDIITNLHPDNDPNTNLYPNIKKENIPSKSISTDKLDDNVLSLIGSLKPSGTDTSTNILAFTSNKGIYVATDNGHWYYWDGSAYADGGVYQATQIPDNSITKEKIITGLVENITLENRLIDTFVINEKSVNAKVGLYTAHGVYSPDYTDYKCVALDVSNCNYIEWTQLQSAGWCYLSYVKNGEHFEVASNTTGLQHLDLTDVQTLYINFFGSAYCDTFYIKKNENILRVSNKIMLNKNNVAYREGLFFSFNDYKSEYTQHQGSYVIPVKNVKSISYKSSNQPIADLYWKDVDDSVHSGPTNNANYVTVDVSNAVAIGLNFIDKNNNSFLVEFKSINSLNKYKNYNTKGFVFNNTKSALFVGDSITAGFTSGGSTTPNGYPKLFSQHYGMTYYNEAVGGAEYCNDGDYQGTTIPKMLTQITNSTHKDVNYLFIAGGINDWQGQNDLSTFRSAVSDTLDYALANYPNAQIILITPINTITSFSSTPKDISVQAYRNALTEVAIAKDSSRITVVQGNEFDFPNETNSPSYINAMFGDGLHPSELGYRTAYLYGLIDALD